MAVPQGYLIVPVGFNPSGDMRALELDADDALKVALSEAAKGLVGTHGWIGGAWRKQPMLFGYSGQAQVSWGSDNLETGINDVRSTPVPAGKVWVVTNLTMIYRGTPPSRLVMRAYMSGGSWVIWEVSSPGANYFYDHQGWWVLAEGDKLEIHIEGATAGDRAYGYGLGFAVSINQ